MMELKSAAPRLADRIRAFAQRHYVRPSLTPEDATIIIRAGDLHSKMGLVSRMPAVCSALGGTQFREENGLDLIERRGPLQSSTATFYFRLNNREQPALKPVQVSADADEPPKFANVPEGAETVFLVSCVSEKRAAPSPAKELYISDWFRKARQCVEKSGAPWFILSAQHGLVSPEAVIEPYEKTLNTMGLSERRAWAAGVMKQIHSTIPDANHIVFFAGQRYREFLEDELRTRGITIDVPMNVNAGEKMHRRAGVKMHHGWREALVQAASPPTQLSSSIDEPAFPSRPGSPWPRRAA